MDKIEKQATFTGYQPSESPTPLLTEQLNKQSTEPSNKSFNVVEVEPTEQNMAEEVAKEYLVEHQKQEITRR